MRATLAMRMLGQSQAGMRSFCGLMNLHPPVTQHTEESYGKLILDSSVKVAFDSMQQAREEEVTLCSSQEIAVPGDGSWRRQGFSSLQGVATLVGAKSGKVIDAITKNSYCQARENAKRRFTDETDFELWKLERVDANDWSRFCCPNMSFYLHFWCNQGMHRR